PAACRNGRIRPRAPPPTARCTALPESSIDRALRQDGGAPKPPSSTIVPSAAMMTTHKSFCRFCHAVCGIEVDVEDGRVVDVRGDRDHVVSQGYLCVKGRELAEQHTSPARLRGTVRRTADGTFVPVASEDAMDAIAERIAAIVARDGPNAIAVYSGTHGLF